MATIHIHRQLSSDTLPELRPLIGKTVDIIVRDTDGPTVTPGTGDWSAWPAAAADFAGSVLHDDAPFEPAVPADEWEANR